MNHNTEEFPTKKFTYVELTETANYCLEKCKENFLNPAERLVLEAAWIDVSYEQIAREYGYSPSYLTKVASKLWRQLFEYFDRKVNKTNVVTFLKYKWLQSNRTAFLACKRGFTYEILLEIADELIFQHRSEHLKEMEVLIMKNVVWENDSYIGLAIKKGCLDLSEISIVSDEAREVGEKLFQQLSEALGEEVDRKNCISVLEQASQRQIQRNLIEDRAIDSVDNAPDNSTDGETVENANDSLDVNLLVEEVKNGLGQMLSVSLDEAVSTANVNSDTEFNLTRLLESAENLTMQSEDRPLKEVETAVLKGLFENQTIAEHGYSHGHINNARSELWQLFSKATNEYVSKTNCIPFLKRRWQQKANSSSVQTQVKDYLFNFLFSHKSVGNLVKNMKNKIWHKFSEVWQAKATPENWRAAFKPKFDRDTKLTEEIVLQVIDSAIFHDIGEHLNYLQEKVLCGTWQGQTYSDISLKMDISTDHINSTGGELWQKLSKAFAFSEQKINKKNFKQTFERWFEDMKLSFT